MSDTQVVMAAVFVAFALVVTLALVTRGLLAKHQVKTILRLPVPVFVGAVILAAGGASALTSRPFVCNSCHPMNPAVKSWYSSAHKDVSCLSCHRKSGILARPIEKLEQGRMAFNYAIDNYEMPVATRVGNRACLTCHDDIVRGVMTRFQIKMSHAEVVDAEISCLECHAGVAHKSAKRARALMMEKCSSCHNDEVASSRCETCHTKKVSLDTKPAEGWAIAHDKNWLKVHGSRSLHVCKSCHTEKDCTTCHIMAPHPVGWPYVHGDEAKKRPDACVICHTTEGFCQDCHRVAMPHPAGWLAVHQQEIKVLTKTTCTACHAAKDCDECHGRHRDDVKNMRKGGQ